MQKLKYSLTTFLFNDQSDYNFKDEQNKDKKICLTTILIVFKDNYNFKVLIINAITKNPILYFHSIFFN